MEKGTPIGSQTLTYIPNWAQSWRVPFPCSSDLPLQRGHLNECPLLRLLPLEHTADLTFQARPSPGKPHHICSGFLISQPGGSGNPKISQKSILSDSRRATGFQGCLFQYLPGPFLPLPSSPSVPLFPTSCPLLWGKHRVSVTGSSRSTGGFIRAGENSSTRSTRLGLSPRADSDPSGHQGWALSCL